MRLLANNPIRGVEITSILLETTPKRSTNSGASLSEKRTLDGKPGQYTLRCTRWRGARVATSLGHWGSNQRSELKKARWKCTPEKRTPAVRGNIPTLVSRSGG